MKGTNLPIGHTPFSWLIKPSGGSRNILETYGGHTMYSLTEGSEVPYTIHKKLLKMVRWSQPLTQEYYVETFYSDLRRTNFALMQKALPRQQRVGIAPKLSPQYLKKVDEYYRDKKNSDFHHNSCGKETRKTIRFELVGPGGQKLIFVCASNPSITKVIEYSKNKLRLKGKDFELLNTSNKPISTDSELISSQSGRIQIRSMKEKPRQSNK